MIFMHANIQLFIQNLLCFNLSTFALLYVCAFVRLYICTFVPLYICTFVQLYFCQSLVFGLFLNYF